MWKLLGERQRLNEYGYIRDEFEQMFTEDPDKLDYGGQMYIRDHEDFFRRAQLCIELQDDSYYAPEHIANEMDSDCLRELVRDNIVIWQ